MTRAADGFGGEDPGYICRWLFGRGEPQVHMHWWLESWVTYAAGALAGENPRCMCHDPHVVSRLCSTFPHCQDFQGNDLPIFVPYTTFLTVVSDDPRVTRTAGWLSQGLHAFCQKTNEPFYRQKINQSFRRFFQEQNLTLVGCIQGSPVCMLTLKKVS